MIYYLLTDQIFMTNAYFHRTICRSITSENHHLRHASNHHIFSQCLSVEVISLHVPQQIKLFKHISLICLHFEKYLVKISPIMFVLFKQKLLLPEILSFYHYLIYPSLTLNLKKAMTIIILPLLQFALFFQPPVILMKNYKNALTLIHLALITH